MGWEYHRRNRARNGTFATSGRKTVQLHLRMTPEQADFIRHKAVKHKMSLSEYCYKVAVGFYSLKTLYNQERLKNRHEEGGCPWK